MDEHNCFYFVCLVFDLAPSSVCLFVSFVCCCLLFTFLSYLLCIVRGPLHPPFSCLYCSTNNRLHKPLRGRFRGNEAGQEERHSK